MLQTEIHQYLKTFFQTTDCSIEDEGNGYFTVQLSIDMDKELMNRPFYWTYLEKTGGIPNPMKLTFITDQNQAPDGLKGELIHFGAPRLHQIFQTAKKLASHIRLFEIPKSHNSRQQVALYPWLLLNVKISYQTDLKKDVLRSFGLHLINGTLIDSFNKKIETLHLQTGIPDYCFTVTPIIKPLSAINRIENYIQQEISKEDLAWAVEAKKRWDQDLQLLNHFYEEHDEVPETYEIEKSALQVQYEPQINIKVINGGLVYLTNQFLA